MAHGLARRIARLAQQFAMNAAAWGRLSPTSKTRSSEPASLYSLIVRSDASHTALTPSKQKRRVEPKPGVTKGR